MPSLKKKKLKQYYSSFLEDGTDIVAITYQGLSVGDLTSLRQKLRKKSSILRIIKNNIFKIALKEHFGELSEDFNLNFRGPVGIASTKMGLSDIAKLLSDYSKENSHVQLVCGFMDSSYHSKKELDVIASLPSRDELFATLMASLCSPASSIIRGFSEIITSIARGVQVVAEKKQKK